jgi:hypothetical protein
MFGALPEMFKSEDELQEIWSRPDTRKKLLEELKGKGYVKAQLAEFQKVLHTENSDQVPNKKAAPFDLERLFCFVVRRGIEPLLPE